MLIELVDMIQLRKFTSMGTPRPVVFPRVVVLEGFVTMKGFVALTGLVGIGVFPFAGPLPFAMFAHVLPQYGCTMIPSLYFGRFLQYLRGQIIQQFPDCDLNALAHIAQRKGRIRPRVHVRARAHARFQTSADIGTSWQAWQGL